jgi:hypothetical protein
MGALKGSLTYSKFQVRGDLPEGYRDAFVEAVRLRAFTPLSPSDDASEGAGWCAIGQPLVLELDHEGIYWDAYLNLGMRVDKWRIPSAIFKAHYETAETKLLEELGRERLSRAQKDDLKTMVTRRLRELVMPTMSVIDLSWHLDRGELRFFHRSPRMHELLIDLFEQTFGLELVLESAYLAATRAGLDEDTLLRAARLDPTLFAVETA